MHILHLDVCCSQNTREFTHTYCRHTYSRYSVDMHTVDIHITTVYINILRLALSLSPTTNQIGHHATPILLAATTNSPSCHRIQSHILGNCRQNSDIKIWYQTYGTSGLNDVQKHVNKKDNYVVDCLRDQCHWDEEWPTGSQC